MPVAETVRSGRLGGSHAPDRPRAHPAAGRFNVQMGVAAAVPAGRAPCGAQPREDDGEFEASSGRLVGGEGFHVDGE